VFHASGLPNAHETGFEQQGVVPENKPECPLGNVVVQHEIAGFGAGQFKEAGPASKGRQGGRRGAPGFRTRGQRRSAATTSPETDAMRREAWFLLYVAEYRNQLVEANVRMALNRLDFSASHLELIEILNVHELESQIAGISENLSPYSCRPINVPTV
jgi:hypothetical protein